jgi:hypothetical protein
MSGSLVAMEEQHQIVPLLVVDRCNRRAMGAWQHKLA